MPRALLIGSSAESRALAASALPPSWDLAELAVETASEFRQEWLCGTPDLVILTPDLPNPISAIQRLRSVDSQMPIIVLIETPRHAEITAALRFAPLIGSSVRCIVADQPEAMAELGEAFRQSEQRQRTRLALAAANQALTAAGRYPRRAAELLERLLDYAPIGIVAVDGNNQIQAANRQAAELLTGLQRSPAGQELTSFFPPHVREELGEILARGQSASGPAVTHVIEYAPAAGAGKWLEVTVAPLGGRTRRSGALVIFQDITARVLAEQEREAVHARLSFLAHLSTSLSDSLDLDGTLGIVARSAIPSLADFVVVTLFALPPRWATAAVDPAYEPVLRALAERHLVPADLAAWGADAGGSAPMGHASDLGLLPGADDAAFDITFGDSLTLPLATSGRTIGVLRLMFREAGRRYTPAERGLAAELAIRSALVIERARLFSQLEQTLRLRDVFLSTAAHDLKSPLAGLKGTAQILRRHLERRGTIDPPRLISGLDSIDSAASRMTRLVDELLDVIRIQAGRPLELDRRPADLIALVRRALAEVQNATELHHIVLETDNEVVVGRWDPARLERVLGNLLDNAVKYSPRGGQITVRIVAAADRVQLSVADQGIGIPADDLPQIFERFHRGANVGDRISGTGLGLASAYRIVEQHGGRIDVASTEGVGTTVTIELPR